MSIASLNKFDAYSENLAFQTEINMVMTNSETD